MHLYDPPRRKLTGRDKRSCREDRSEKRSSDFHAENLRIAAGAPQLGPPSLTALPLPLPPRSQTRFGNAIVPEALLPPPSALSFPVI
jgi:hypothetical protein